MSSALLLTKVDDLFRGDHFHLGTDDSCYFIREYIAYAGFSHCETNDLILNLKKSMDKRGKAEWRYKDWAIRKCAEELIAAIEEKWTLEGWLLVPAPPSKTKAHESYDDRMVQIAQIVGQSLSIGVVELLECIADREPQHSSKAKRNIEAQILNLQFNGASIRKRPKGILVLDDVLTTGATFQACKAVLKRELQNVPVAGLFVARRVPQVESDDFDDSDLGDEDD
jgi:hypothetical protein